MQQDQASGPSSIQEPNPYNPHSNFKAHESSLRPKKLRKSPPTYQLEKPKKPTPQFTLSETSYFAAMKRKSDTDKSLVPEGSGPSRSRRATWMEKCFKLPSRTRSSQDEHPAEEDNLTDDSSAFFSEIGSHVSDYPYSSCEDLSSSSPARDSMESLEFKSVFSDDSSLIKPRQRLKIHFAKIAAKLADPRLPLKKFKQDRQRSPQRPAESIGGSNDLTAQLSTAHAREDSKPQLTNRESNGKTREVRRRYRHERRMTWG